MHRLLKRARFAPLLLLLLLATASPALAAALRLPAVIGEHMVLQRELPVPIWGWAEPGATVTVQFKGQSHEAVADEAGKWRLDLEPLEADAEPAELTVTSGDQSLTVGDILVGEVWICTGQSNMQWKVRAAADRVAEAAAADWPQIRLIETPRRVSSTPEEDMDASWSVCSPRTAGAYTAVGYYFGRHLHRELGVPIGLINCNWGGTRIEPWTPIQGLAAIDEVKPIYEDVLRRLPNPPAGLEPAPPFTERGNPTTLYNGMMAPVVPFALRGAIWYQGESNRADGMDYFHKSRALLAGWREVWERPELPFYFVQIAPFQYKGEPEGQLPLLWEAQQRFADEIDHTGMIVISDIGNVENIHPQNKQDVGLRLANLALKEEYGRDELLVSGPRFRRVAMDGNKVLLRFDYVGEGLASRDGQPLTHFEIAGPDGDWAEASARLVGIDSIELTAEGVANPTAVRFGWHKLATPNLMNSAGLPAAPFRASGE